MVYGRIRQVAGLRLSREQEHEGADPALHRIASEPELDGGFPG